MRFSRPAAPGNVESASEAVRRWMRSSCCARAWSFVVVAMFRKASDHLMRSSAKLLCFVLAALLWIAQIQGMAHAIAHVQLGAGLAGSHRCRSAGEPNPARRSAPSPPVAGLRLSRNILVLSLSGTDLVGLA